MRRSMSLLGAGLAGMALSMLITSCNKGAATSSSPSTNASSSMMTTPVQTGFGGQEHFCAQQPLGGEIDYNGTSGDALFKVTVDGLPSKSFVVINWLNNTVRGYAIGSFLAGHDGSSVPTSLRLFRPGETRGYEIILTTASDSPKTLGVLWPCRPPPRVPALSVDDPKVMVTPDTGLSNGQVVRVGVTGFGANGKVWISECDHAEAANYLGCGARLAAQPFLVTTSVRFGSTDFTVRSSAPSKPFETRVRQPCTNLCVIEAEGGGGAWAVAPIAFGSSQFINP
jgi:hypothetical protein